MKWRSQQVVYFFISSATWSVTLVRALYWATKMNTTTRPRIHRILKDHPFLQQCASKKRRKNWKGKIRKNRFPALLLLRNLTSVTYFLLTGGIHWNFRSWDFPVLRGYEGRGTFHWRGCAKLKKIPAIAALFPALLNARARCSWPPPQKRESRTWLSGPASSSWIRPRPRVSTWRPLQQLCR